MKKNRKKKGYIDRNESFDDFLAKEDLLAEAEDAAIKDIVADQLKGTAIAGAGATPQS